jgi:Mn-dependent DtxR family transcriptional regulator
VDEKAADKDACEIEHVISDGTLVRLVRYLESIPETRGRMRRR